MISLSDFDYSSRLIISVVSVSVADIVVFTPCVLAAVALVNFLSPEKVLLRSVNNVKTDNSVFREFEDYLAIGKLFTWIINCKPDWSLIIFDVCVL